MRSIIFAAITTLSLAAPVTATTFDPFTGFVGFGDSFSDKGRLKLLQPPSNGGRFTDGITWMEMLGAEFEARGQANFNMALGGATAGPDNTFVPLYELAETIVPRDPTDPDDIPSTELATFAQQVDAFEGAGFAEKTGSNPLVTILLGANDFGQNPLVNPATVIGSIVSGILDVAALGPQYDSFMVGNLPDFSIQPSNLALNPLDQFFIREQSQLFNETLTEALGLLSLVSGLEIEVFDFFGATDAMYLEAIDAALILDDTCLDALATFELDPGNQCLIQGSSSAFLWLDNVHPGDFAHQRWGAAAIAQVQDRLAPIPLPAGIVLFLTGFAGLAATRKRAA